MDTSDLDTGLKTALEQVQATGCITPMVKLELQLKVQARRLSQGKQELPRLQFKEPEKYPLTEEEEQKREVRRLRNRVAAQRCRQKKKTVVEKLDEERKELRSRQIKLKRMVQELESAKDKTIKELEERNIEWASKLENLYSKESQPTNRSEIHKISRAAKISTATLTSIPSPAPVTSHTAAPPSPTVMSAPTLSPAQFATILPPPYTYVPPVSPVSPPPSVQYQDQNNIRSYYTSVTPPPSVFMPLEISTSRDFDPVFTFTSPSLSTIARRRPSSTTSFTDLLEDETLSPSSLHVTTEPPSCEPLRGGLAQDQGSTSSFGLSALSPCSTYTFSSCCQAVTTPVQVMPGQSGDMVLPVYTNQTTDIQMIPTTVFDFLQKDHNHQPLVTEQPQTSTDLLGFDEAQVPGNFLGYLGADDEKFLTLYDYVLPYWTLLLKAYSISLYVK